MEDYFSGEGHDLLNDPSVSKEEKQNLLRQYASNKTIPVNLRDKYAEKIALNNPTNILSPKEFAADWFGKEEKIEDWQGLLELLQHRIKNEPESPIAWAGLGEAYDRLKQYEQAIHAYREALRIRPEYAEAWNNLGVAYANFKQYDQAIQANREALRIQPEYAEAWNNLGVAYSGLKQYDQAIQAYRKALRIRSKYAAARYNLGATYYFQGQPDKVREIYQTLRILDPAMAERYFSTFILP